MKTNDQTSNASELDKLKRQFKLKEFAILFHIDVIYFSLFLHQFATADGNAPKLFNSIGIIASLFLLVRHGIAGWKLSREMKAAGEKEC